MPHLWPTGSSLGQPPLITARYFSSCPSDSTSRWTPCPPESYQLLSGQRGITPAFGYDAPHPSARGTLTLLNNVLLSTQYEPVRLPTESSQGYAFPSGVGRLAPTPRRDLPGSSTDLSPRAVPNHPGESAGCLYPLLHQRWQASSRMAVWPLSVSITRPNRFRLRYGSWVRFTRLRVTDCSAPRGLRYLLNG